MQYIVLIGLRRITSFATLPETALTALAAKAKQVQFTKGETISRTASGQQTIPVATSPRNAWVHGGVNVVRC